MNGPPDPSEALSPAERRLGEHLELLRANAPRSSTALVKRIVHAARWQRAIRRPLLVVANLAAAVVDGVRLLVGSRAGRS